MIARVYNSFIGFFADIGRATFTSSNDDELRVSDLKIAHVRISIHRKDECLDDGGGKCLSGTFRFPCGNGIFIPPSRSSIFAVLLASVEGGREEEDALAPFEIHSAMRDSLPHSPRLSLHECRKSTRHAARIRSS